ncbi:MAG: cysteine desulfurase family protein [Myxococcota bacterium]
MKPRRVYVDYNATAPVRPEIRTLVEPILFGELETGQFANASSVHWAGQAARKTLEKARSELAKIFDRKPSEILFTSGGSEANNLVLQGVLLHPGCRHRRLVTSSVEHAAVRGPAKDLQTQGVEWVEIPVDGRGHLDLEALEAALETPTGLVSIMAVNNETGIVHDVAAVRRLCATRSAPLMVDAVQAPGRIPLPDGDFVILSGHKLGGLKGAGVLIRRDEIPLLPRLVGGPQERGLRAGTEDVAAAVALVEALRLAEAERGAEVRRLTELRDRLEEGLKRLGASVVGAEARRIGATSTVFFEGIEGEVLLQALDLEGVAASSGSACSSGSLEPSHVLLSMGYTRQAALSAIRFSLGWASRSEDVDHLLNRLPPLLERIRG